MDNDLQAIHQLVRQLYLAISFNRQGGPDWDVLRSHFWEKGQLVRSGLSGIEHYTVEQFTEWVDTARANGLGSFQEEETDSTTHLMGHLATAPATTKPPWTTATAAAWKASTPSRSSNPTANGKSSACSGTSHPRPEPNGALIPRSGRPDALKTRPPSHR